MSSKFLNIAVMIIGLSMFLYLSLRKEEQSYSELEKEAPLFDVGTCVKLVPKRDYYESWEKPISDKFLYKILEIGKSSYRVHIYNYTSGWTEIEDFSLPFAVSDNLEKIDCPKYEEEE